MIDKWLQTFKISWSTHTAYKLNFLLMVIGPAVVFFFVKYNVWASIYNTGENLSIQGYDLTSMIEYQAWVLLIGLLAMGHSSMNLAIEIRMGQLSKYLIYPFEFWQFHMASFIAFQVIQLGITAFTLIILLLFGLLPSFSPIDVTAGLAFASLVSLLWFLAQYSIGLIAFWLEETWVLRVMFIMMVSFFSGAFFPLEIFPPLLKNLLFWTPFPYMTYVPVKIAMGTYQGSIVTAVFILAIWILIFYLIAQLIWKSGMKLYTAAGM